MDFFVAYTTIGLFYLVSEQFGISVESLIFITFESKVLISGFVILTGVHVNDNPLVTFFYGLAD